MDDRQATFNPTSFAEGRFRRAYKGIWTAPLWDAGRSCVVKECKASYTWKATDWDETVKITEKAKELANEFNTEVRTNRPITYTNVHVMKVVARSNDKPPKLNEYVTCEDYIEGDFNKWCSNYGYIGSGSTSLPAFMHWSWWHTDSELMVADLQGVRKERSYLLTDPVIMSLSGNYGATDTSVEGMAMFFMNHQCNSLCNNLSKPSLRDFKGVIPERYLQAATALLIQLQNSTTYRVEMKFPLEIRARVAAKFREIAKN